MILKEVYNSRFLQNLSQTITKFDKKFDQKSFLEIGKNKSWAEKSLKQRMRAIVLALDESLSGKDFQQKVEVLKKAAITLSRNKNSALALIIFPDFIEVFGMQDFDYSMSALEFFTEFGSSEFAVRQFIKSDQKRALKFIKKWTKSKNHHVRRLASEGIRPALPWGEALVAFKKNPTEILLILEELKHDEEIYVRKSVANNLNDISKNQPELIIDLLKKWQQQKVSPTLIKHALRTLLKKGNQQALALIGIKNNPNFTIQSFALQKNAIKMSENLVFDFLLENKEQNNKIRLEYALYFLQKNQSHFKKIFQITTKDFPQGNFVFSKKHSFREITTRKYNKGLHAISLVANGIELTKLQFELI